MDNDECVEEMIAIVLEAAKLLSGEVTSYNDEEKVKRTRTSGKPNTTEMSTTTTFAPGVMTRSMRNKKAMSIKDHSQVGRMSRD
jgi:hypothetical protein